MNVQFNNLPKDFNENIYYYLNPDVEEANKKNPLFTGAYHYSNFGCLENRPYKFDVTSQSLENKNIVIITSKIYVSTKPFSYINTRSVYTSEERFYQTIDTINSIKKYIPNAFIILFDNSKMDTNDHIYIILKKSVDLFLNNSSNKELNYYTDEYSYKAFADISQQIEIYNIFLKHIAIDKIGNFFKISGRYTINKDFQYLKYHNNKNIFKKNKDVLDRDYYYTSFYKLDKNILKEYFEKLILLRDNKHLYENNYSDIEVIVPNSIIDKITQVDTLGITQRIAVTGNIDEI
jgi:hypothetical protein